MKKKGNLKKSKTKKITKKKITSTKINKEKKITSVKTKKTANNKKNKITRKDYINISILVSVFIIIILLITQFKYIYGSTKDWDTQHWVIPEYFRTLFYSSKNPFPNFAFNLGGGQNIFNLAYYGLYSPHVFVSYLFPFIDMMTYMIIVSILVVIASIILMYVWLRKNKFDSTISFIATFTFLCSSPLIFHSHRHIMFINYMPFLILALMAVDKFFETKKRSLLILSTFLIIMTSYFYSVGSLVALFFYGTYKYLNTFKKKDKFKIIEYIKWNLSYVANFLIAIFMAAILILPTFYSLLNGRSINHDNFNYLLLIIPKINIQFILYNSYSIGLTSIFIISLISCLKSTKKGDKFLFYFFAFVITFGIVVYLLNGTMYIDSKVLIPFLPICCLLIASFFKNIFRKNYKIKKIVTPTILIGFVILIFSQPSYGAVFLLDISVVLLFLYQYNKHKTKQLMIIPIIVLGLTNCLLINFNDKLVSIDSYKHQNIKEQNQLIEETLEQEDKTYRFENRYLTLENSNRISNIKEYKSSIYSSVSNTNYKNFYYKSIGNDIRHRSYGMLTSVDNVIYNMYMGNKYILSDTYPQIGYEELNKKDNLFVYKNDNVLPIGYASNNVINKEDFLKLEFPYNSEAILKNIIVDEKVENTFESAIEKYKLNYIITSNKNTMFKKDINSIEVRAEKNSEIILKLSKPIKDKILFIKFKIKRRDDCKFGDETITINGIKNKVTCKTWKYNNNNDEFQYVISSNDKIDELKIEMSKGLHIIHDIKTYTLDYKSIKDVSKNVDEFIIDKKETISDTIVGNINASQDKYFHISIPYDKGFNIYVDGKKQEYERTDLDFIGFKITKGNHKIKIVYEAPLFKIGMIISMFGFISFISIVWMELKKK